MKKRELTVTMPGFPYVDFKRKDNKKCPVTMPGFPYVDFKRKDNKKCPRCKRTIPKDYVLNKGRCQMCMWEYKEN